MLEKVRKTYRNANKIAKYQSVSAKNYLLQNKETIKEKAEECFEEIGKSTLVHAPVSILSKAIPEKYEIAAEVACCAAAHVGLGVLENNDKPKKGKFVESVLKEIAIAPLTTAVSTATKNLPLPAKLGIGIVSCAAAHGVVNKIYDHYERTRY